MRCSRISNLSSKYGVSERLPLLEDVSEALLIVFSKVIPGENPAAGLNGGRHGTGTEVSEVIMGTAYPGSRSQFKFQNATIIT